MPITGILLAAGRGSRFGADKLMAVLPAAFGDIAAGTPIGVAAGINLHRAITDTLAVVRADRPAFAALLRDHGLHTVACPDADRGMGATLACGVTASRDADGWVVALADMPWIRPKTIGAIVAALASGADIAAPVFGGRRGHPVGFARRHLDALAASSGDAGARAIVEVHQDELTLIDVDDPGVVRDVDVPHDLSGG
ncbi:MAG TPA: nucleotidyltransferase family protein [Casimicrobiaceae bacterium]